MHLAMVGFGRMGLGLALRAQQAGHHVTGWDLSPPARARAKERGVRTVDDLQHLREDLDARGVVLVYVPHGDPVDAVLEILVPTLADGDIVVDGGNSHWEDSLRRHDALAASGIEFLDVGTSGGTSEAFGWRGAAFMVGGDRGAYDHVAPLLRDLAVDDRAVYHVGPPSTGHFVKLVHNAIEFGMLQAIAEGVELLVRSPHAAQLDLPSLFDHWNHGSVIRSWLVELMANALREHPSFDDLSPFVEDTGEVKWVVKWALDQDIPVPVTALAQEMLMTYRDRQSPAAKAVALLRNQFGGHPLHRADPDAVSGSTVAGKERP